VQKRQSTIGSEKKGQKKGFKKKVSHSSFVREETRSMAMHCWSVFSYNMSFLFLSGMIGLPVCLPQMTGSNRKKKEEEHFVKSGQLKRKEFNSSMNLCSDGSFFISWACSSLLLGRVGCVSL